MRLEKLLKEEGARSERKLMLKKKFRLPSGTKFNNSRLISNPLLTIKTKKNGLLLNRFSTIVSKKIDKRAVVRNRIKRLINSCMEELYKNLKQGHDMIIIAKRDAININRQEFCREINLGLKKAGFLK